MYEENTNNNKKSLSCAFSIIAGINTIVGLWGYTIKDINADLKWWQCGLILLASFIIISVITFIVLNKLKYREYFPTCLVELFFGKFGNCFVYIAALRASIQDVFHNWSFTNFFFAIPWRKVLFITIYVAGKRNLNTIDKFNRDIVLNPIRLYFIAIILANV